MQRQLLDAARSAAAQPGLPDGQRYCTVWHDPTPDHIESKLAAFPDGAWADGDDLTFACRSDTPYGLAPGPVFVHPMFRLDNTDLWVLQVRVERLAELVAGYGFWELDETWNLAGGQRGSVDFRFRGADAPAELASTPDDELAGEVADHEVPTQWLGGPRTVTTYLPPNGAAPLRVVYATDGAGVAPFLRRLDAAITAGSVPPCAVVAAHAAPMTPVATMPGASHRTLEYFPAVDPARFDAHQHFFVDELAAWAQATLGVSSERADKAIFGYSDGGAHAMATAMLHPGAYAHAIAYSSGWAPEPTTKWDADAAPFVHLCAGTLEGGFYMATQAWAAWLHFADAPHSFTERVCGHDLIQWIEELPRALERAWG